MSIVDKLVETFEERYDEHLLTDEFEIASEGSPRVRIAVEALRGVRVAFHNAMHGKTASRSQSDELWFPLLEHDKRVMLALRALREGRIDEAVTLHEIDVCTQKYRTEIAIAMPPINGKGSS